MIMTDSCNAAQKARRLLQHLIGGYVFEMDCHHHLQNVWIKGMEKSVGVFLRVVASDSLEQIPAELRVICIFSAIACAWDNFFSLCANYPKGQGEHVAAWLRVNKPGTALYHVVGAQGSRHNLCLEAAPAIYMNRYVCFDYASYLLRLPKKTRQHPAAVFICVDDIQRDHRSITFVRNPLHFFLCAHAMAGSQDTRAWKVGLGTDIKR